MPRFSTLGRKFNLRLNNTLDSFEKVKVKAVGDLHKYLWYNICLLIILEVQMYILIVCSYVYIYLEYPDYLLTTHVSDMLTQCPGV